MLEGPLFESLPVAAVAGTVGATAHALVAGRFEGPVLRGVRVGVGALGGILGGILLPIAIDASLPTFWLSAYMALLSGYVASSLIPEPFIWDFHRATRERFEKGVEMRYLQITYRSDDKFIESPPFISIQIENLEEVVGLRGFGEIKIAIPDDKYYSSEGLRVLLSADFEPKSKRGSIAVLARVWKPEAVVLNLTERRHLVGSIHAERASRLSADIVERGCEVSCLPPSEQFSAPGRCVVCKLGSAVFELCC